MWLKLPNIKKNPDQNRPKSKAHINEIFIYLEMLQKMLTNYIYSKILKWITKAKKFLPIHVKMRLITTPTNQL